MKFSAAYPDLDAIALEDVLAPATLDILVSALHWGSQGNTEYFSGISTGINHDGVDLVVTPVPEPLTMIAIGISIAGLGGYIRRRRMASK